MRDAMPGGGNVVTDYTVSKALFLAFNEASLIPYILGYMLSEGHGTTQLTSVFKSSTWQKIWMNLEVTWQHARTW